MKMTIEPTELFFMAGDVMVRAWEGEAEDGSTVIALVAAVAVAGAAFEHELTPIPPPAGYVP